MADGKLTMEVVRQLATEQLVSSADSKGSPPSGTGMRLPPSLLLPRPQKRLPLRPSPLSSPLPKPQPLDSESLTPDTTRPPTHPPAQTRINHLTPNTTHPPFPAPPFIFQLMAYIRKEHHHFTNLLSSTPNTIRASFLQLMEYIKKERESLERTQRGLMAVAEILRQEKLTATLAEIQVRHLLCFAVEACSPLSCAGTHGTDLLGVPQTHQ